jgi:hypothetical protein
LCFHCILSSMYMVVLSLHTIIHVYGCAFTAYYCFKTFLVWIEIFKEAVSAVFVVETASHTFCVWG